MQGEKEMSAIGCNGSTIKVHAGHYIDLLNPRPDDIDLDSAATAISRICRYGGHSPKWYTVAEHSYHAAMLACDDGMPHLICRAILLHDLAEAYLGDVVKPLKVTLGDVYADIEWRMEQAISDRFVVDIHGHHDTIKYYDLIMLKAEKRALWGEDGVAWSGLDRVPNRSVNFKWWKPSSAKGMFLEAAKSLGLS